MVAAVFNNNAEQRPFEARAPRRADQDASSFRRAWSKVSPSESEFFFRSDPSSMALMKLQTAL